MTWCYVVFAVVYFGLVVGKEVRERWGGGQL